MTTPPIQDLPVNSVVASADRVWIKRSNAARQPPGSPFHETWWIEATTYAIQVPEGEIMGMLRAGEVHVLRPADTARPSPRGDVIEPWPDGAIRRWPGRPAHKAAEAGGV